jgi:hypothetical protein
LRPQGFAMGALILLVAVLIGTNAAAAPAPTPASRWQVVPGGQVENEAVLWSAGRLWLLSRGRGGAYVVRSGRVTRGRLGDWKTARPALPAGNWVYQSGPGRDLLFTTSGTAPGSPLLAFRLMPNGSLGSAAALGGAPVPESSGGSEVIQLTDRAVRLVGIQGRRNERVPHLGACCDVGGAPVDFASFIPPSSTARGLLGVDRRGRVWLAWVSERQGKKQQAQLVELFPATLKPNGRPAAVPGLRGAVSIRSLVCTDSCRVLAEGMAGRGIRAVLWGIGERPIAIAPRAKKKCAAVACGSVIDARQARGHLLVAYWADASGLTVGVARADARGRNLKRVRSVVQPRRVRNATLSSMPFGAFGPDGFAAVAPYSGGSRAVVRVAILRAR